MEGALIILAVTILVGVLLWAWEKMRGGKPLHHHTPHPSNPPAPPDTSDNSDISDTPTPEPAICCGLHAICEKTGQVNEPPVYYDDEELDVYAGREAESYSDEEIEIFRDVLLTLRPEDAPGWAVSLQRRHINLPAPLKPELDLILTEL